MRRRDRGGEGNGQAQRLGDDRHGAGGTHHHAGADRRRQPAVDQLDLGLVDGAGAIIRPQPAAIGAGAERLALVVPDDHRPDRNHHGRQVGADRAHDLRRQRLVAAADHDQRIHRLRPHHFLGVHGHQIAQHHAGRMGKGFVDADGRKHHRQRAGQHHPALDRFDQLRRIAVAGIVVARRVGDADDRPVERVVGIAGRLDERLAQEQREGLVAVARHTLPEAAIRQSSPSKLVRRHTARLAHHKETRVCPLGQTRHCSGLAAQCRAEREHPREQPDHGNHDARAGRLHGDLRERRGGTDARCEQALPRC